MISIVHLFLMRRFSSSTSEIFVRAGGGYFEHVDRITTAVLLSHASLGKITLSVCQSVRHTNELNALQVANFHRSSPNLMRAYFRLSEHCLYSFVNFCCFSSLRPLRSIRGHVPMSVFHSLVTALVFSRLFRRSYVKTSTSLELHFSDSGPSNIYNIYAYLEYFSIWEFAH